MTTSHAPDRPSPADHDELLHVCQRIRRHIVEMTHAAQSGHPGGSLSATEIFAALYFGGVMRHDPANPQWERRDRAILSKGHATPVVYATLAEAGYFDAALIPSFRSLGTELQGHVVRNKPAGVEMSGGALGMGLSFAVGIALGHDLNNLPDDEGQVFVVVGDGRAERRSELGGDYVCLAFRTASHHRDPRPQSLPKRRSRRRDHAHRPGR